MEKIIKYRMVHFFVEGVDPITRESRWYEVNAHHGQRVHTESAPTDWTPDGVNIWGVPEDEIQRLVVQHGPDVFFSDEEIRAGELGVTDDMTVVESTEPGPRGDTMTSPAINVSDPDAAPTVSLGGAEGWHPLAFSELSQWQMNEYFKSAEPTPEQLADVLTNTAKVQQANVAAMFSQAENEVTGGEPRSEVSELLAEYLGAPVSTAGSEGIPGTAPGSDEDTDEGDGAEPQNAGSGSSPEPTPAASKLAEQEGVNLSEVDGTGTGGRITEADVKRHLSEQDGT